MELVDGETLDDRLAVTSCSGKGGLPLKETLQLALQIANALDAAHERGIVHRDLKPANIEDTLRRHSEGARLRYRESVRGETERGHRDTTVVAVTRAGRRHRRDTLILSPEQATGKCRRPEDGHLGIRLHACTSCSLGIALSKEIPTRPLSREYIEREPDWSKLPAALPPRIRDSAATLSGEGSEETAAR